VRWLLNVIFAHWVKQWRRKNPVNHRIMHDVFLERHSPSRVLLQTPYKKGAFERVCILSLLVEFYSCCSTLAPASLESSHSSVGALNPWKYCRWASQYVSAQKRHHRTVQTRFLKLLRSSAVTPLTSSFLCLDSGLPLVSVCGNLR